VAVGGLAIAHSTGQGQELTPGSSSSLLDTIALVPSPSPSPSPAAQAFSAKVTTPATSECDERCRTIWGLGAYGDWDRKCTQEKCSACAECTSETAPTPLDLCRRRYENAIAAFPPLETDREARLRGDKSLDAGNVPHMLFVHIGKTCGDTVIAALNHNKRKIISLDMAEQEDEVTNRILAKYKADVREPFDMVHVHPVRPEVLANVQNVIIPMRDPVDRLISAYNSAACKADGVEDRICERKAPPHWHADEDEFEEFEDVSESEALRVERLNMPPRKGLGPVPAVGGLIMQCFPNVTAFGEGIDDDTECGRVARDMIGLGETDAGAGHVGKGDCYYLGGLLEQLRTKRIHLIHTDQCGVDIATIPQWLGLKGDNSQFEPTPDRHQGDYPHHYDTVSARARTRLEHHLRHEYALQAEIRRLANATEAAEADAAPDEPKEGCVSTGSSAKVTDKWCTANCAAGNCPPEMCVCAGDAAKRRALEAEEAEAAATAAKAAEEQQIAAAAAAKAQAEAIEEAQKQQAEFEKMEAEKAAKAKEEEAAREAQRAQDEEAEAQRRAEEEAQREKDAMAKAAADEATAEMDEAERQAAEAAARAKAKAAAAAANETRAADLAHDQVREDGWHPEDAGLPAWAPAPEGSQDGAVGDNCWLACGKKAGKCFDEETGKGFCGKKGVWSGSCCRAGAVGAEHAPECGFGATSSRGCSMNHCCIDDASQALRKKKREEGIARRRREEAEREEAEERAREAEREARKHGRTYGRKEGKERAIEVERRKKREERRKERREERRHGHGHGHGKPRAAQVSIS